MRLPAAIGSGLAPPARAAPLPRSRAAAGRCAGGVPQSPRRTDRHPTGRASHPGCHASGRDGGSDPEGRTGTGSRYSWRGPWLTRGTTWHGLRPVCTMRAAVRVMPGTDRAAAARQAARADGAAPTILEPVPRGRCAMPPTILVVDDDLGLRHALAETLVDAGYAIEQASDGLMALRQIARQVPDLILSDVRMPHLDGIGLAATLAPHMPLIPIILMSAQSLPSGCGQPFIRKPFDAGDALDADGPHAAGLQRRHGGPRQSGGGLRRASGQCLARAMHPLLMSASLLGSQPPSRTPSARLPGSAVRHSSPPRRLWHPSQSSQAT